ncbi:MAG: hypothetical protein RIR70_150 [Pseudomonadota bacterium]|jgi:cyclopropane-fatty-acyl-phospholipid synthase
MWHDRLIRQAVGTLQTRNLPLAVRFWNGIEYQPATPRLRLDVRHPAALGSLRKPTLGGLARAYVEGHFDIDGDLKDALQMGEQLACAEAANDARSPLRLPWFSHSRQACARDVAFHYDVSNDFYALWLDQRRVYSCAYFREPQMSLDAAQEAKLEMICKKLMLAPGDRLLDIGCGWGGLVFHAAERFGARALGITLSQHQFDHVREEIRRRGLSQRVEVRLCDYRDLEDSSFDKIASIGMFEHVGRHHLPAYFERMQGLLKPGGLALNHGITLGAPHAAGLRSGISDFIEDYVFPGGELTHISRVLETLSGAGLETLDVESWRVHYARTLWHWTERLDANLDAARALVGERACRIWRIYMAGSAHAFSRGWLSLFQVLVGRPRKDGSVDYPYRRDHLYLGALSPDRGSPAPGAGDR